MGVGGEAGVGLGHGQPWRVSGAGLLYSAGKLSSGTGGETVRGVERAGESPATAERYANRTYQPLSDSKLTLESEVGHNFTRLLRKPRDILVIFGHSCVYFLVCWCLTRLGELHGVEPLRGL